MRTITKQEQILLVDRMLTALEEAGPMDEPMDILADIYCRYLPFKTHTQGLLIAQEIIEWMARFQEAYETSLDTDTSKYARDLLEEKLKTLSDLEKCQALTAMIYAMEVYDHRVSAACLVRDSEIDPTQLLENFQPYTGEGSPEEARRLLHRAVNCLENNNQSEDMIQRVLDSTEPLTTTLQFKANENLYRAIAAMVIYTMVINNEIADAPAGLDISYIIISLCQEDYSRQVCKEMNLYDDSWEQANESLHKIRSISKFLLGLTVVLAAGYLGSLGINAFRSVIIFLCAGTSAGIFSQYAYGILDRFLQREATRTARKELALFRQEVISQLLTQEEKPASSKDTFLSENAELHMQEEEEILE